MSAAAARGWWVTYGGWRIGGVGGQPGGGGGTLGGDGGGGAFTLAEVPLSLAN